MDKEQLKAREAKVIELATAFCKEHLDDECADLCTKMVQKLGRKRTNPLQSGRLEIWAGAVVYTICSVNYLFYKDAYLTTSGPEIAEYFGAKSKTLGQKSRDIKDMLRMKELFDPEFTLEKIAQKNPFLGFASIFW